MKNEDLINRLLEGNCSEVEIELIIKKINNNEINKNELKQQIQLHAILEQGLHQDQNGSQIFRVISSLKPKGNESISSRVMRSLPSKPKNNNLKWGVLSLAAILFLSFFVWQKFYIPKTERGNLKVIRGESIVSNGQILNDVMYQISLGDYGEFVSKDAINLTLFSESEFKISKSQIDFYSGKFLADIGKRKINDPLQIMTGELKTTITGTKFCLNYLERNNQKDYLLQLFEGSIDVEKNGKKLSLNSNEFLYFSGTDKKWVSGKLSHLADQKFDNNVIYISPAKLDWIPFFWESWTPDKVKISDSKSSIELSSQNGATVALTSQVVKTLKKGIQYSIVVYPELLRGKMEIGLRCSYEGKFSYLDAFEIEGENNKFKIVSKKVRLEGNTIGAPQLINLNDLKKLTFSGEISHSYYLVNENNTPAEDNKIKPFIEDVVFELYLKTAADSAGNFRIGATKIIR